jgi:hypothetical protein
MCFGCHQFTPDRRQFLPLAATSFAATTLFGRVSAFAASAMTNVNAKKLQTRNTSARLSCALSIFQGTVSRSPKRRRHGQQYLRAPTVAYRTSCCLPISNWASFLLLVTRATSSIRIRWARSNTEPNISESPLLLSWVMKDVALCRLLVQSWRSKRSSRGPSVPWSMPSFLLRRLFTASPAISSIIRSAKALSEPRRRFATKSQIVSHLIKADKVKVLAARYDLDSGGVEFLTS